MKRRYHHVIESHLIFLSTDGNVVRRRHVCLVASLDVAGGVVDSHYHHPSSQWVPDVMEYKFLKLGTSHN